MKDANELLVAGREQEIVTAIWNAKLYRPDGVVNVRDLREEIRKALVMGIGQAGNTPRVGDTFEVAQNPDMPGDVTFPERGMMETMAGFGVGGLGLFVLAAAFFLV